MSIISRLIDFFKIKGDKGRHRGTSIWSKSVLHEDVLPCQIRDRLQRCGRKHELGKDSRIYKKMPLSIAAEKCVLLNFHVIFKCTLYVSSLTFILSA